MRITGNEIWFDSTLVGHLELGTQCFDTVLQVLEDAPDGTLEWEQARADAVDDAEALEDLRRRVPGLERENLRQFRQIEALEAQILRLQNRVAELGGGVE